jgi:ATP-binding cassette subfamily B protein
VVFSNVWFAYPSRPDEPVLRGIDLSVRAGEKIALVGPSGAGKSTLAALVCRLFEPQQGTVLIDGRPAQAYPLSWLRGQMAFVPQEILLFGGTIGENIAYGKPATSTEEIRAAAIQARALDFIEALPMGLETPVGDRGSRLSGGQRQRLALARAILRDPAILVLDEATSALDSQNESLIQEALDDVMATRTSFIIAHRLSTVRRVDRIVVLADGRVVETGTHAELHARGGVYRDLCDHQYFDPDSAGGGLTGAGGEPG